MKKLITLITLCLTLSPGFLLAARPDHQVNVVYAQIKSNFAIAIQNSNGQLTWKDWDKYKGPLRKKLTDHSLNTNQIWAGLKADFRQSTANKAWSSWDIITGKSKQHTNLHDLHAALTKLTQTSATPHLKKQNTSIDAKYALIKAGFKVAVDNSKGTLSWKDWDKIKGPIYHLLSQKGVSDAQFTTLLSALLATSFNMTGTTLTTVLNYVQGTQASPKKTAVSTPQQGLPNYLYTRAAIQAAVASPSEGRGKVIPYFGYWRPADIKARTNNNGFWYLSNYFVSDPKINWNMTANITFKGQIYSFDNVEAAFQAGKCLISGYISTPAQINEFVRATPDASKYLANTKYKYQYKSADAAKIDALMTSLVRQKFINGPLGRKLVRETGETTLIEGNAWDDAIWGAPFDGVQHVPAKAGVMKGKQGQNKLGKMLVVIRGQIKSGQAKPEPAFAI